MTRPKPPAHLSRRAKTIWRKLCEEYDFECDALTTLQLALENLDLADKARELLESEGLVDDKGRRHPATDIIKQSHGLYLRAMRALALDVEAPGGLNKPGGR